MEIFAYVMLGIALGLIFLNRGNIVAVPGQFMAKRGNDTGALPFYRAAYKIGGFGFDGKLQYGYLTLKTGDSTEAGKIFTLISMEPLSQPQKQRLKALHALVFWEKGDSATAQEMLLESSKAAPHTDTYGRLGYIYNNSGDSLSLALPYNREAYEYNSQNALIVFNLAYSYHMTGDRKNAKKYYKEAAGLNPTFPDAYFYYGKLLIETGYQKEGLAMVRKALPLTPAFWSLLTNDEMEAYLHKQEEMPNE